MRLVNADRLRRKLPFRYRNIIDAEPTAVIIEDFIKEIQSQYNIALSKKDKILKKKLTQANLIEYEKINVEIRIFKSLILKLNLLLF